MTSGHALSPPTVLHIDSVIYLFILLSVLCVGDQRGQKKKKINSDTETFDFILFFSPGLLWCHAALMLQQYLIMCS